MLDKTSDILHRIVVICAPTASGKTDLVCNLFSSSAHSQFYEKAEIISADSMQVYKYMDIGTAKPDIHLQKKLPHHLIDICKPNVQFGTGDFVRYAKKAVEDIISRNKIPVIVGGTAFYIKNFVYGLPSTPQCDEGVRLQVEERMKSEGAKKLWDELHSVDAISANRIHINDEYRIKRALEVYMFTGSPLSSFEKADKMVDDYNFLLLCLQRPRQELYDRVEQRVELMFEQGLEKEFNSLISMGYNKDNPGMKAIGYREFFTKDTTSEIKELIIKNTKEYVKRQQTFFKTFKDAHFVPCDNQEMIQKKISEFIYPVHS